MALSPIPASPDRSWPMGALHLLRDEASLRSLICHVARLMHQFRFVDGAAGSISARLGADRILITPAEFAKSVLQPDQLLVVDLDGIRRDSASDTTLRVDDELAMHLACYRQRPDIAGVVHAHSPMAVALTLAGVSLRTCFLPEAVIVLGLVPTTPYAPPTSPENLNAIRLLIAQHDAMLMAAHGSLTVGADVWQAYLRLETLEHTALILHSARQISPIAPLSPDQVAALLEIRRARGFWREGDADRFCEACGVCSE